MNTQPDNTTHYRSFQSSWEGFKDIKPINIIIGKNGSGKTTLLHLVDISFNEREEPEAYIPISRKDVGRKIVRHISSERNIVNEDFTHLKYDSTARLYEKPPHQYIVDANGNGGTNTLLHCLLDNNFKNDTLVKTFLYSLNSILPESMRIDDIYPVRLHNNFYSICIKTKGRHVAIPELPSGVRSLLLAVLNMEIIPCLEACLEYLGVEENDRAAMHEYHSCKTERQRYVFTFEEMENHTHPSLLRSFYAYIKKYSEQHQSIFFLTTHSTTAIDMFHNDKNAQIVRVAHDGEKSSTQTISTFSELHGAISELGARPSDLLLANGIVWLEGPTDRIYFNKWLSLISLTPLQEGRDYQCAFYGGSLLSHHEVSDSDEKNILDKVNIIDINPNAVVICDSDKTSDNAGWKQRVKDIHDDMSNRNRCSIWVTEAKEIENYIPLDVLCNIWGKGDELQEVGQYGQFWSTKDSTGYFKTNSPTETENKVQLAKECVEHMNLSNMKEMHDWWDKMTEIHETICKWNGKVETT